MIESYHVQPAKLWVKNSPYPPDNEANSIQIDHRLVKANGKNTLKQPKQTFGKRIPKNEDHTYNIPTTRKGGREVRPFN